MIDEDYNFFLRNENMNTDSDSFSNIKDNASTYMGVKTIQEGTVADTDKRNKKEKNKNKKKKNKAKKKKKKRKKSSSESSSYSSSSESDLPLKENALNENSDFSEDEKININDFEEVKIDPNKNINEDKNKNNSNNYINDNNNTENNKNEIKTEFFWDEGGNSIYLTGSFCQWKDFYLMEKNEQGIFYKNLMLPPGFHQYKFKVDNNWAYSKKQPKFEDSSGNVNNFIDTTKLIMKKEIKKSSSEKSPKKKVKKIKSEKDEKEKEIQKDFNRNKSTNSIGILNNSSYSTYIPLKNELRLKPLAIPGLFKTHYILNEKKNKNIKVRKFSQIEYVDSSDANYFLNNNSYVGFHNLYHIHSNHFHSKEMLDSNNTITSIITRYRAKYSTFIYYKDEKNKNIKKNDKKMKKGSKVINGHKNAIYK